MLRLSLLGLLSLLVAGPLPACVPCNEIGCDAGFYWRASPENEDQLEDSSYALECTVAEGVGTRSCTEAEQTGGSVAFFVMFEAAFESGSPPHGFLMRAWQELGDGSLRGPRDVAITIHHDGVSIVAATYELEYVRDDDFWGDRRCGYRDLAEERTTLWPSAAE
jgi:hypothetical protein